MDCCKKGMKYLVRKEPPVVTESGWYLVLTLPRTQQRWKLQGTISERVDFCPWCCAAACLHEPRKGNQ